MFMRVRNPKTALKYHVTFAQNDEYLCTPVAPSGERGLLPTRQERGGNTSTLKIVAPACTIAWKAGQ
jgi:hypothetical protein